MFESLVTVTFQLVNMPVFHCVVLYNFNSLPLAISLSFIPRKNPEICALLEAFGHMAVN